MAEKEETKGLIPMGKFCELVGLSNQRILDMIKDGTIKTYKVINGKHWLGMWAINEYIVFLRAFHKDQISNRKPADLEKAKLQAEVDYKNAKARVAEMQCNEIEGTMHHAEIVEQVLNDFVFFVKNVLLSLPGRMAIDLTNALSAYFLPDNKATPAIVSSKMKIEINAILEELANYKYDKKKMTTLTKEKHGKEIMDEDQAEEG